MSKFCVECGNEVAEENTICSNCGAVIEDKKKQAVNNRGKIFIIVFIAIILTFFITILLARNFLSNYDKTSKCSSAINCKSCTSDECICHYKLENGTISDETIVCPLN